MSEIRVWRGERVPSRASSKTDQEITLAVARGVGLNATPPLPAGTIKAADDAERRRRRLLRKERKRPARLMRRAKQIKKSADRLVAEAERLKAKRSYRTAAINAWYAKKDMDAEALLRMAREP